MLQIYRWWQRLEEEKKKYLSKLNCYFYYLYVMLKDIIITPCLKSEWMHLERYFWLMYVCTLSLFFIILFYQDPTHDFHSGLWRVSFEWKITYMFMVCLLRSIIFSHLATSFPERYFKMRFPFWESYFVFIQQSKLLK